MLVLCAGTAAAQEVSTAVVPVVGSVFGATMERWKTDVEIINDTGRDTDVALELPFAPDSPAILITLAAGQSQRFVDLTGQAFGIENVLSPMRVTTSGRRSVSVRASVYAIRENAPPSMLQPLSVFIGPAYYPRRSPDGLAFSDDVRTNIGLVNFGETDAEFLLALQRIPGRTIAVSPVFLRPGSMIHTSIQSLFPLISEGSGFSVVIETNARDSYVYASVIENATQAGRFIAPRVGVR
jgi:hypothetical protein